MRRAGWIGGAAAIVVAAGLAYAAAEHVAQTRLASGLDSVRAALGPRATLRYARAKADPFTLGATLEQAAVTRDDAVLTADRVVLHGVHAARISRLTLINPALRRNGIVAGAATLTVDGLAPDPAAGRPDAIRFDHAELADLMVSVASPSSARLGTGAPATGGPALVLRSGAMQIDDVATGTPGHILLQDASLTTQFGTRTVVHADALRYDDAALAATLNRVLDDHPAPPPAEGRAALQGGPLTITGDRIAPLRAASLRVMSVRAGSVETTAVLQGLHADLNRTGSLGDQLGYRAFDGDLALTTRLDPATGRLGVGPLVIDARDMAMTRLEATLTVPTQPAATPAALWTAARFDDGRLAITDKGIARHILAMVARQHGVTPEALQAQLAARIRQTPADPAGVVDSPEAGAIGFLARSGTLTFTLHPSAPLPLLTMTSLRGLGLPALMETLGLQVQLTPAP